jgi:hypothetical protein
MSRSWLILAVVEDENRADLAARTSKSSPEEEVAPLVVGASDILSAGFKLGSKRYGHRLRELRRSIR